MDPFSNTFKELTQQNSNGMILKEWGEARK
jgi:hypothetical protein